MTILNIESQMVHAGQTRAYGDTVDEYLLNITHEWHDEIRRPVGDGWAIQLATKIYGMRTLTKDDVVHCEPIPAKGDRSHGLDSYVDFCRVEAPGLVRIRVVTPYND